jgi:hypothetical protein
MKSFIVRSGLLACLLFLAWSHGTVSAEVTWPSKCEALGELKPNQNPTSAQINCLLTNAALEANIPPEVVKAVAFQESGWKQYKDGQPLESPDGGIGIMQITNQSNYDLESLKNDIIYNIQAGIDILKSSYDRKDLPKIKGAGPEVIESWYFPVMAYNGIKPVNSPLYKDGSGRNTDAYQEKVFTIIKNDSFINNTELAEYEFSLADFDYDTDSRENIKFNKMEYVLADPMHPTVYHFQKGDKVIVAKEDARLRSSYDSSTNAQELAKNTTLIIDGDIIYDQYNSDNRFVWYPVKVADQPEITGYITSAYIAEKLEAPIVNAVNDQDVSVTGRAPFANVMIQIMNGADLVGSAMSDANGDFQANIPAQKAGEVLNVTYKDNLNRISEPASIEIQPHVLNGWVDRDGKRYHYTLGVLDTGWVAEGQNWYYLDANGVMQTGWIHDGHSWYYLSSSGVMQTGWIHDGQSWYYLSRSGAMQTGWMQSGSTWYYLQNSGAMAVGWVQDSGTWYYFKSSGAMSTGWVQDRGTWYYFKSSGAMVTGWLQAGATWYYFQSSGAMQTGWAYISNKWYYFDGNGALK